MNSSPKPRSLNEEFYKTQKFKKRILQHKEKFLKILNDPTQIKSHQDPEIQNMKVQIIYSKFRSGTGEYLWVAAEQPLFWLWLPPLMAEISFSPSRVSRVSDSSKEIHLLSLSLSLPLPSFSSFSSFSLLSLICCSVLCVSGLSCLKATRKGYTIWSSAEHVSSNGHILLIWIPGRWILLFIFGQDRWIILRLRLVGVNW